MVRVLIGDLFASQAQTLVNTVNCVGVMGKGIALEFRNRFPEMYKDYVQRCERGEIRLGRPYLYKSLIRPWVLNFPTKDHWRSVTKLQDIEEGLVYLRSKQSEWGIESLAVPPLGCGQGQLEWRVVGPTLYRHLDQLGIPVELYAPHGTPHEELQPEFFGQAEFAAVQIPNGMPDAQFIRPGWVALVEILDHIEREPYHWPIGRTTFQKIAYVATEEGLPTGIRFQRGSYGPFAPELKTVMTKLQNNGLIEEIRLGRMFAVKPGPTFRDARRAYGEDIGKWQQLIQKVADLFMRTDTTQAEIVSTILFAARNLARRNTGKPDERDVLLEVAAWKQRRRPPLNEGQIAFNIRNLAALGWLDVEASPDLPLAEGALADVS